MCLARFEAAFWRKERHCEQQVDKGIIGYVGAGGNLPGLRTQAQSETMKAIAIRGMLAANAAPRDVPWQPPERRVSGSVDAELKLVPCAHSVRAKRKRSSASVVGRGSHQHAELIGPETRATGASNFHAVVQFLNAISRSPRWQ